LISQQLHPTRINPLAAAEDHQITRAARCSNCCPDWLATFWVWVSMCGLRYAVLCVLTHVA